MAKCLFDHLETRDIFKGENALKVFGRFYSETVLAFVIHAVAARIIGTQMLRPALVGSLSVGCGYALAMIDHHFFKLEDHAHHITHRITRSVFNAFFTYTASKYLFPINWKWPVMSVLFTSFFCELERTKRG